MQNLGATRSTSKPTHLLQTPDTFVRTRLPGMRDAMAIVHASPANGARFAQYTAEMATTGSLDPVPAQRFIYVLDGAVTVTLSATQYALEQGGFAYLPQGLDHHVVASVDSRIEVFEKPYLALDGLEPPAAIFGRESDLPSQPLMGDTALQVRSLLPDTMAFDFAVNIMEYQPGAVLPMVEMHVMEHGLLMLQGGGIYRLDESWYPVTAGDFIWMAPYCPQWFGALGKVPAKYLIYKDWNRNPLA
ncbi:Ureidoglycine aminohydrolase [Acidisarcina polymorpha]|uniref:Ureidoglycine aminohydrolase n=1 Tax=Acidisarcina polymorpha TaxID=2211140 RepID=A0A2Z5FZ58_9BACT|nr:(S)-ureidoglycine aminohydrolase [Acidisarcina polymorpha]AXC11777.1 Ureidoglycine aminohydrolase [Acidisarcina polymorpha]